MPDTILDHRALEAYLPHRGINLLPDTVTLHEGGKVATSVTTVPADDVRQRTMLGRRGGIWYEPFLGELMALTGVPLLHERLQAEGAVAVFSMISKLVFHRLAPLGSTIIGRAEITRDRGTFTQFATTATVDGEPLLEAEVMSGVAPLSEIIGSSRGPAQDLPAGEAVPLGWLDWKPPHLRFATTIVSADAAAGTLTTGYRYEPEHPFVPGHFPAGPLMMGVTQWSAVADAGWIAMQRFGLSAATIQGRMTRPDGSEIVDVRDLELIADADGIPCLTATKRIAFRDKIVPGDSMLTHVTVVPK